MARCPAGVSSLGLRTLLSALGWASRPPSDVSELPRLVWKACMWNPRVWYPIPLKLPMQVCAWEVLRYPRNRVPQETLVPRPLEEMRRGKHRTSGLCGFVSTLSHDPFKKTCYSFGSRQTSLHPPGHKSLFDN